MNPEDQIKALAKLDGLKPYGFPMSNTDGEIWNRQGWTRNENENNKLIEVKEPDYLTSRDAIVPVIEKQIWINKCEVAIQLRIMKQKTLTILPTMDNIEGWCVVALCATPAQLCEALLRATGKWTE